MHVGGKHKTHNRLWLARKRRRLRQKQVAYLLNHHTVDQISRYEKGLRVPTLETALMLEIIYATPLRVLFKELYERLQDDIGARARDAQSIKSLAEGLNQGEGEMKSFCTYGELLSVPSLSQPELDEVRKHVTHLARRIAYL